MMKLPWTELWSAHRNEIFAREIKSLRRNALVKSGKIETICFICFHLDMDTVLNCGHAYCGPCAHAMTECSMCRCWIRDRIKVFARLSHQDIETLL